MPPAGGLSLHKLVVGAFDSRLKIRASKIRSRIQSIKKDIFSSLYKRIYMRMLSLDIIDQRA